jgi:hypothetical protein
MRSRFAALPFAFALLAAIGFASCGGDDATAVATADVVGSWTGSTSQEKPMLFTVNAAGVSQSTFTFALTGSRCFYTTTLLIPTTQPIAISDAHFSIDKTQVGINLFVSGTGDFKSSSEASGTFAVQDGQCGDTLSLTWNATRQ